MQTTLTIHITSEQLQEKRTAIDPKTTEELWWPNMYVQVLSPATN